MCVSVCVCVLTYKYTGKPKVSVMGRGSCQTVSFVLILDYESISCSYIVFPPKH